MNFDLQEYLNTKHVLRFGRDGKFRILILTDIHARPNLHPQSVPAIEAIIDYARPDLVLLGGDITGCRGGCSTAEELRFCLDAIAKPMESRKIPWAHVYGNHDDDLNLALDIQQQVYESYTWCVSKRGPRDIHGVSNYVLPIFYSDRDEVAYNVWGVDSHDTLETFFKAYSLPEDTAVILPEHFGAGAHYEPIHTDQVLWYYATSQALEENLGRKVPGLMYMHTPLMEFYLVAHNPAECRITGRVGESVGSSEINTGMFAAFLQRGDIRGVFCGHDHHNDFSGTYCNILLAYCAAMGYDISCEDEMRGGRIVELNEHNLDSVRTYMLRLRDIMGSAADKRF